MVTWLHWNGHEGKVKHGLVALDLHSFPPAALPGRHVVELIFSPSTRYFEVRESGQPWRPMTVKEKKDITHWLDVIGQINTRIMLEECVDDLLLERRKEVRNGYQPERRLS